MPRIPRAQEGGHILHVLNRGNARQQLFRAPGEYENFIDLLSHAKNRVGISVYAFCLMPNHFHLVAQPQASGAMSEFMQWLLTSHVRRHHQRNETSGHLWQGRYKSFPVQDDGHFLTLLRYVLLNPVRAKLASDASEWAWSSLKYPSLVDPWPVKAPSEEGTWLKGEVDANELKRIRNSISRRTPFGDNRWRAEVAQACGLEPTLHRLGRPRLGGYLKKDAADQDSFFD